MKTKLKGKEILYFAGPHDSQYVAEVLIKKIEKVSPSKGGKISFTKDELDNIYSWAYCHI